MLQTPINVINCQKLCKSVVLCATISNNTSCGSNKSHKKLLVVKSRANLPRTNDVLRESNTGQIQQPSIRVRAAPVPERRVTGNHRTRFSCQMSVTHEASWGPNSGKTHLPGLTLEKLEEICTHFYGNHTIESRGSALVQRWRVIDKACTSAVHTASRNVCRGKSTVFMNVIWMRTCLVFSCCK